MDQLVQRIRDALNTLGDNADEIAHNLAEADCRGQREVGDACPVYHYLHRQFPGSVYEVDGGHVVLIDGKGGVAEVGTPQSVAEFIAAFDAGDYDELEAQPS